MSEAPTVVGAVTPRERGTLLIAVESENSTRIIPTEVGSSALAGMEPTVADPQGPCPGFREISFLAVSQ